MDLVIVVQWMTSITSRKLLFTNIKKTQIFKRFVFFFYFIIEIYHITTFSYYFKKGKKVIFFLIYKKKQNDMKHLKLYEEYTDSTMDPEGTQTPGKTTPKPGTTGAKPKEQFLREVNFYSASDQKQVKRTGWINLQDFDRDFEKNKGQHRFLDGSIDQVRVIGTFYRSKMDAFEMKGQPLDWHFGKGDLGNNGDPKKPIFTLFAKKEPGSPFIPLWNQKLNLFLRDRYLQKNSSGVWVQKVESGGFGDSSSMDKFDKFA